MASSLSEGGRAPEARKAASPLLVTFTACLGLALLALAVPRTGAALFLLWSASGDGHGSDALGAGSALHWAETLVTDSAAVGVRARKLYALAVAMPDEQPGRAELLRQAMAATEALLRISPAQPDGWLRLAVLREMAGDRNGAVLALRLSFLAGPFVPELMEARLLLSASLLDHFSQETLPLAYRQVRLVQDHLPELFARLSQRRGMANLIFLATSAPSREAGPATGMPR